MVNLKGFVLTKSLYAACITFVSENGCLPKSFMIFVDENAYLEFFASSYDGSQKLRIHWFYTSHKNNH